MASRGKGHMIHILMGDFSERVERSRQDIWTSRIIRKKYRLQGVNRFLYEEECYRL